MSGNFCLVFYCLTFEFYLLQVNLSTEGGYPQMQDQDFSDVEPDLDVCLVNVSGYCFPLLIGSKPRWLDG